MNEIVINSDDYPAELDQRLKVLNRKIWWWYVLTSLFLAILTFGFVQAFKLVNDYGMVARLMIIVPTMIVLLVAVIVYFSKVSLLKGERKSVIRSFKVVDKLLKDEPILLEMALAVREKDVGKLDRLWKQIYQEVEQ